MATYLGYGLYPAVIRPAVVLNGWGANGHVGDYEGGVNQGHSNPLVTDPGTTSPYVNPGNAVDADPATACTVSFTSTHAYAGCVWGSMGALPAPQGATLNITSQVPAGQTLRDAGMWYTLNNGSTWTLIYQATVRATTTDVVTLPPNVDLTQLQVMAFLDSHDDMAHNIFDINVTIASVAPNSAVYPVDSGLIGNMGAFNGGFQGMTFCKNIFVLQRDFWDPSLSTPYSGQIFPTGGNSGGPGQVYPF